MPLSIITKEALPRSFLVYDLEWVPETLQVRMAGVYDPEGGGYRAYKSVYEFLENELSEENRGRWFYAHAGGLADVQFVMEEVIQYGKYEVKVSFSGSSAIIVHVVRGKNSWHFVDSYWLLRDSLENIGKSIGMVKGENVAGWSNFSQVEKKQWYAAAPFSELRTYNEQDCVILYNAIERFEQTILGRGSQLKMTLASTAMELFRRKFLKRNIDTSHAVNDKARQAYFASRVEVFSKECEEAFYYDINSSFPYSMTKPCPGDVKSWGRKLPDHEDSIYIADCDIEVPESYFPPTPVRIKDHVYFPTGRWRSWLSSADVHLLQRQGGKVRKNREVISFEPFSDMADYAKEIYEHRKNSLDPFERTVDKLLMNSLYGKFGESEDKQSMHVNPNSRTIVRWEKSKTAIIEQLFPGCWLETNKQPVVHMHVPASVHITALSRTAIFNFMSNCRNFHYVDTDGFSTNEELGVTGNELGLLKLERNINHGMFIAPKLYKMDEKVKAKGFSLSRKPEEAAIQFQNLVENKSLAITRMVRLRELYRKQETVPREAVIMKGLTGLHSGKTISKRQMYPDGTTRPWSIDELRETA